MILAIDTSAAQCAVALYDPDSPARAPVIEREPMERDHAAHLFPMIDAMLARAGAGYGDIGLAAVCTGPGSFTGLRIGVAATRGIALGRNIPAIGITRFEALVAEVVADRAGGPIAICLAGRSGTVYLQCFAANGTPLAAPQMLAAVDLAAAIPGGTVHFAGDAVPAGQPGLLSDGLPDPAVIARLAAERAAGPLPAPLYLRGADADPPREGPPVMLD